jgi:hypothetical protein
VRSLNCGVMRPIEVIRWLLVVPSAIVAWYFALLVGMFVFGVAVAPCWDSDAPRPQFCDAAWFPLELVERGVFFFGVGLAAALVVVVSALVAPSRRTAVAYTALAVGTIAAGVMGYLAEALAEAAVAVVCGFVAALAVSRFERNSNQLNVARKNVVPSA